MHYSLIRFIIHGYTIETFLAVADVSFTTREMQCTNCHIQHSVFNSWFNLPPALVGTEQVSCLKSLGVILETDLNCEMHVEYMVKL